MCGIFGYFCNSEVDIQNVLELLKILEKDKLKGEETHVGGHGAGICFLDGSGNIMVHKVGKTNSSPAKNLSSFRDLTQQKSRIILGHVRHASSELMYTIEYAEATQPYKVNCLGLEVISAHNGYVRNYTMMKDNLKEKHQFESEKIGFVDSEVIPHLFEEKLMTYRDEAEAGKKTWQTLEGNNAAVLLSLTGNTRLLHLLHKGHSRGMHVWKNNKGEIILCSREKPLRQVFDNLLKEGAFEKILSIEWRVDKEAYQVYEITQLW